MCAKMAKRKVAKVPQTDWTRAGRDISNMSIPLYQEALTGMGNILRDQDAVRQAYIDKYYGADSARNSDFLRAYQRGMGQATANNWAATTGGYTSSGNKSYTDQQRYWNDLASRLQDYGVQGATNLVNSDLANLMNSAGVYNNAYQLGRNYSQIEQQNAVANQANKNWLGQGLSGVGKILSAIPTPVTMGLGAAMQLGGNLATTDTSQAMSAIYGGGQPGAGYGNLYGDAFTNIAKADWTPVVDWWNKTTGLRKAGIGQNVGFAFNKKG